MADLWSEGLDQGFQWMLGVQEQKSREADRRVREKNLAAELAQIQLRNQQIQTEIQQKALQDAEWMGALSQIDALHKAASIDPLQPVPSKAELVRARAAEMPWNYRAQEMLDKDAGIAQKEALAQQRRLGRTGSIPKEIKFKQIADQLEAEGDAENAEAFRALVRKELVQQEQAGTRLDQSDRRLDLTEGQQQLSNFLRQRGLDQRDIDQALRLRSEGAKVVSPPGAPVQLESIPRPPTTATVSAAQEASSSAKSALASIDRAVETLEKNPDAAGITGAARELIEGLGGQLGIEAGTRITGARTELRDTAHQLVSGLRVESGQMSNWERAMLEEVGSPLKWTLGADTAKEKLRIISRLIAARELRRGKDSLNQSTPGWVLGSLTRDDLLEAVRSGYITPDQAREAGRRRP